MSTAYTVGETFTETTGPVERADFVRYAGASGDFNRIHYDEPFVTDAGYDSVFGQGMFTAGVASGLVREVFGLHALAEYRTRFVAQVWPGDTLTATVEIEAIEAGAEETSVEASVTVQNQDDEPVMTGSVVAVR